MVKINACKDPITGLYVREVPEDITVYFEVNSLCVVHTMGMHWVGGAVWTGTSSGGQLTITIDMAAKTCQFSINHPDCNGSGAGDGVAITCDELAFQGSTGGRLYGECCGESLNFTEITFNDGKVPAELPIVVTPPPPLLRPGDCVEVPGGQASGFLPASLVALGAGAAGALFRRGRPFGIATTTPSEGSACCSSGTCGGGASRARCGIRQLPTHSEFGVRYATGEVALHVTDMISGGFGFGWGHTRSFASRLTANEALGNGFNWKVAQWPYIVLDLDGNVTIQGGPEETLQFDLASGQFAPRFGSIQQSLSRSVAGDYVLLHLDGSRTEFDASSQSLAKHTDAGGTAIEVKELADNGFNPTRIERSYSNGGVTTTEQFLYQYTNPQGDYQLTSVTLRRRVDGGSWENIVRTTYSYYEPFEQFGAASD